MALPHAPTGSLACEHRGDVLPYRHEIAWLGDAAHPAHKGSRARHGPAVVRWCDAVADVFGAGKDDQRSVPEIGRGRDLRGIAQVYSHEGTLVFVVDPYAVTSAADQIDPKTLPPLLRRGS